MYIYISHIYNICIYIYIYVFMIHIHIYNTYIYIYIYVTYIYYIYMYYFVCFILKHQLNADILDGNCTFISNAVSVSSRRCSI